MKRAETIRIILTDLAHGDMIPAGGLIDWLVVDCNVPLKRIIDIGERYFGIPPQIALNTLEYLV